MVELPGGLSLQGALGAIGQDLEERGIPYVQLTIGTLGVILETVHPYTQQEYSWGNLGLRTRAAPQAPLDTYVDLLALTHWPVLLRLVGDLLDADGVRGCVIEAQVAPPDDPTRCEVRATVGGEAIVTTEQVQEHLLRLRARAAHAPPAPAHDRPPWWAFWRRT